MSRVTVLVWTGEAMPRSPAPAAAPAPASAPPAYTPPYLAEKILTSRSALEGERKQVTVLFADLKGSMELLAERDPEEARQLLDPVLEHMMAAVHRYEGTVNQVMGTASWRSLGPLAHEDHAAEPAMPPWRCRRPCSATRGGTAHAGAAGEMRVGLHSGEVVVRAIGNDLHMDYSAVGQTTHLAARMEQLAAAGQYPADGGDAAAGGGLSAGAGAGARAGQRPGGPVEVFELVGVTALRRRLQAATLRGLSPFVGRQPELEALQQALAQAGAGQGQVVALIGEPGVGKSRLV